MALSAPLLTRKRVIQVKIEADKGTAETTDFADVLVFDLEINPTSPFEERKGSGLYLGHKEKGILAELSGNCTFSAELRGNGTGAMDAGLSILLQACGLANTAETYQLHSTFASFETCTIHVFEDGVKKILHGCMGNVSFEGVAGGRIMCNFDFSGIWNAPTDVALPAYTPGTETPPRLASGTFTLATLSIQISKFGLDLGNNVVMRADVDGVGGIAYYMITDYDPVLSIDPEADLVAGYDFFGIWLAGTEAAVSLVLGSGAGKQITFTIPKVQYREIKEADREGIQIYDITGQCNHSTGNDAVAIAVATA